jgi:hypothetical protein
MFAPAYMGRKRCFRMLLLRSRTVSLGNGCVCVHGKAFEGATSRRFRPTCAEANPDFLLCGIDRTACAAFFTESRMKLDNAINLDRKSGGRGAPVQTFNARRENRLLPTQLPLLP